MSTNFPLFDFVFSGPPVKLRQLSAAELRDSGIDSALQHVLKVKAEYVTRCLEEISKMESGLLFTSEYLRDVAGPPPEGCENSIAGILKKAAGQKLIQNTGGEQVAKRTTIHAKKLCVWKKL